MSWNNAAEYAKFKAEQEKLAAEYRSLGMTEEQIRAIYEFDRETYRSRRRNALHTCPMEPHTYDAAEDDPDKNPLVCDESAARHSRYWWTEELETAELALAVKKLSPEDLELLTRYVYENYTQAELAVQYGISQKNISKKLFRIRKKLKTGV